MPILPPSPPNTTPGALAAPTLQSLAREVSSRRGSLILASPSASGSQTTLVSAQLSQYLPQDITKLYLWVYGTATGAGAVESPNQGVERRSTAWASGSTTLTIAAPGFPTAITSTGGVWEVRRDKSRERVVAAINSALGQLGLYCTREFKDESLVGVQEQWQYTLPAAQNWMRVTNVEIQAALNLPNYPYRDARMLGLSWRPEKTTDTNGNTTWQIQFQSQPPPGYIIRVWGEAYYPNLVQETDVLAVSTEWQQAVLEWLYDWALYRLDAEQAEAWSQGDFQKAMQNREAALQKAKAAMLEYGRSPKSGRINTPLSMVGRGLVEDPGFLGAFSSGGISNAPYNPSL